MGALRDAFLKELNKFNNGDYSNLVLHPEVIMNEVDPPYGIHCGKKDVIDYLNQYQTAPFPKLFADPDDLDNPRVSLQACTNRRIRRTPMVK